MPGCYEGQRLPGAGALVPAESSPRVRQGRASPARACATTEARSEQLGDTEAAPASGIGHLPGDLYRPRPGQAVGKAGAQPCCSIAGAEADSPGGLTRDPGLQAGWGSSRTQAQTLRPVGAPWALTL